MLGLDRQATRYTWTVVFILLLVELVYRIRDTLFIFIVALLFAYLLWPLVKFLDRRLPGRSKVLALTMVYLALVAFLIVVGIAVGSRVVQQANALATRLPELLAHFQPPKEATAPAAATAKQTVIATCRTTGPSFAGDSGHAARCSLSVISRAGT